jgi:regulator of sigma E protease
LRYLGPILSLTFAIAVHELGHVSVATLFGIKLERLAIGLGPALFSGRRRGTQLVLGVIPVGAFAQIRGTNPHAVNYDRRDPHSFASKNLWTRALILAAGSLANLALTFAVLTGLYLSGTHVPVPMTLGTVAPGSEAAKALLRPGDVIVSIGEDPVTRWSHLADYLADRPGEPLVLRVRRGERTFDVQIRPRPDEQGKGRIGITEQYVHRQHRLGEALRKAVGQTGSLLLEGMRLVRRLTRENVAREMVERISVASVNGFDAWLRTIAVLSFVLGLFHLLPVPPLDGGRIVLFALEGAVRKSLHPKVESIVHAVGTIALIAGMGWLLARDVARLVTEGRGAGATAPAFLPTTSAGSDRPDAGTARQGTP